MAVQRIQIDRFLELAKHHPLLDVRSPAEYKHAHIPGAHSFPLFSDEERKLVGTAYKQKSREEAIRIGLDFFGPKMRSMVDSAESILKASIQKDNNLLTDQLKSTGSPHSKCLLVYCWRGGMRSAAIAWLLDLYGFKIYTLAGGYKTFRKHVLETFQLPFSLKIVGGYTGSGKTELLSALQKKGETIIDLEEIAKHKGSAFGNIGMPEQPGQEMFENLLAMELLEKSRMSQNSEEVHHHSIWLEDESQRIGKVNIPGALWENMRRSKLYFLDIPFEERLTHIVQEYGGLDQEKLIDAIGRIQDKLGGLNANNAVLNLEIGNVRESFRILLKYYDKFYFKALHNRNNIQSLIYTIECKSITTENANLLLIHKPAETQKV